MIYAKWLVRRSNVEKGLEIDQIHRKQNFYITPLSCLISTFSGCSLVKHYKAKYIKSKKDFSA